MIALAFAEYAFNSKRSAHTVRVPAYSDIASSALSSVVCGMAGGSALRHGTGIATLASSVAQPER